MVQTRRDYGIRLPVIGDLFVFGITDPYKSSLGVHWLNKAPAFPPTIKHLSNTPIQKNPQFPIGLNISITLVELQ